MDIYTQCRVLIRIFACLSLAALFNACKLDSLSDPIVVPDVEREFYIDLWENLYPESKELVFQIETVQAQDCENATISYNLNRIGNTVKLSLNAISDPEDCQPGPAQIYANAPTGRLNGGLYTLKLDLKNTIFNEGQLTVSGDAYQLNMNTDYGFIFKHKTLLRVPEQTYWGYLEYPSAAEESVAEGFVEDLRASSIEFNFLTGYYGHFSIEADSRVRFPNEDLNGVLYKPFIFKYTETGSAIRQKINAFRTAHGSSFTLKVFNARGESW